MTDVTTLPQIADADMPLAFAYVWLPGINGGPASQWKIPLPSLGSGGGGTGQITVKEGGVQVSAAVTALNFNGLDAEVVNGQANITAPAPFDNTQNDARLDALESNPGGSGTAVGQEWTLNWNLDSVVHIAARVAMTISQGNPKIGTGSLTYAKSTSAAPGTFAPTSLPATLEVGAWLQVTAADVSGFCATNLIRTA